MHTKKSISVMQSYLMILFTTCLIVSNLIAAKQLYLPFGLSVAGGTLIFPITYILSDVFSEVYGYKASRRQAYIGFAVNLFVNIVYVIFLAWLGEGPDYSVLSATPRMLAASLIAYLVGDWCNDMVFEAIKTGFGDRFIPKGFIPRAIISSLIGEIFDTCIFLFVAFLGVIDFYTLGTMALTMIVCKTLYEVIISPVTLFICKKLRAYEDSNSK